MNVVGTCAIFGSIVLVDRIGRRRLFREYDLVIRLRAKLSWFLMLIYHQTFKSDRLSRPRLLCPSRSPSAAIVPGHH